MTTRGAVTARRTYCGLVIALGLLAAPAALACSVASPGVDFGVYDPASASALEAAGAITVDCASAFTLTLSPGNGSFASRSLSNGTGVLRYNLYADSARTQVWGDGSGGSVSVSGGGAAAPVDFFVYGRILSRQNVAAGNYADSLVVTLSF